MAFTDLLYEEFKASDFENLFQLALKLWTDYERSELREILLDAQKAAKNKFNVAKDDQGNLVGFVIVSIRHDHVEGSIKSPTGYLEGVYVKETHRSLGVAKRLVHMGEQWLKQNGCSQIGSDTWLWNKESQRFHEKIGFVEEERLVHFIKDIE